MAWLAAERRKIDLGTWCRVAAVGQSRGLTVHGYADRWWSETVSRHKPRTRVLHRGYLDNVILPGLGDRSLSGLTVGEVRAWYAGLEDFPARNANAYSLLRTIEDGWELAPLGYAEAASPLSESFSMATPAPPPR